MNYRLNWRDWLKYGAAGAVGGLLLGWLFYRSAWAAAAVAAVLAVLFPLFERRELAAKRQDALESELCEALGTLSVTLRSGYSFENALCETGREAGKLRLLGPEWKRLQGLVEGRVPPEQAFAELAERTGLEELLSLSAVIGICRGSGGNLSAAVAETVELLKGRQAARADRRALLSRKRTEQRIVSLMPFLVFGMLALISESYLDPLYSGMTGRILMTVCLAVMLTSVWLSARLSRPEE